VAVGAANTPDRDAAAELLEEHAIGEDLRGFRTQPPVVTWAFTWPAGIR